MVKLLIELKCCISFTDDSKRETLNSNNGQTALYWIVTKMPDIVSLISIRNENKRFYLNNFS